MTINLEKKVIVVIAVLACLVAIATIVVIAQKKEVRELERLSQEMPATSSEAKGTKVEDSSSAIVVGSDATKSEKKVGAITEINWELLYQLDYKTGKAPDNVKKLHKSKVRLPGFIVPLSDDLRALKEFLLVPNAQACIHVPPPPPNLIVYVTLSQSMPIEKVANPSWIEGTLFIEKTESEYGAASYRMKADKMEEYKF